MSGWSGRRRGARVFIFSALAIAIGALTTNSAEAQGPPATPVRVDPVRVEDVSQMFVVTGDVEARRRSVVASEEEGLIRSVNFDAGDAVNEGEALALIDVDLLEIQRDSAKAALAESKAAVAEREVEVAQDERDLESLLELQRTNAAGPKEVADAESDLALSRARLKRAELSVSLVEADIRRIERKLRGNTILAPFTGVITIKHAEVGQWIDVGGPVVELIGTGVVDAVINAPEQIVNHLEVGMPIEVTIRALEEPVVGTVRSIVPLADVQARTYPVKIELDDQSGRIKPGMSLRAWAPTGEIRSAVTVDRDAVMRSPTGAYVYAVRDGTAVQTPVETRASAGEGRVVVLAGGLNEGDFVVVEGNERLYPGAAVSPTNLDDIAARDGAAAEGG